MSRVLPASGIISVMSRRKKFAWALAMVVGMAASFTGWNLWRATRELRDAGERVASESHIRFTSKTLVPVLPAGLESVAAPAVFSDAAIFHGHIFVAGPAALDEYDPAG